MSTVTSHEHEGSLTHSTLLSLLIERAHGPQATALTHRTAGAWRDVTWHELWQRVCAVSEQLIALGLEPQERVAIFADNSLSWLVCDLAITAARAITVCVYPTSTGRELAYVLNDSEAVFLIVDHDAPERRRAGRVSRSLETLPSCRSVRRLVTLDVDVDVHAPRAGRAVACSRLVPDAAFVGGLESAVEQRVRQIQSSDPACLIYSAGTSGDPKGLITTHRNWICQASALRSIAELRSDDSVMMMLSPCLAVGQALKASWLFTGLPAIVGNLSATWLEDLAHTRPSVLPAAPQMLEVLQHTFLAAVRGSGTTNRWLLRWAVQVFERSLEDQSTAWQLGVASWLLRTRGRRLLLDMLGGRVRMIILAGPPLSEAVARLFDALGLGVLEGYGTAETCGAVSVNRYEAQRRGTAGEALAGVEVKLADDGEILVRGGNVTAGYFRNPRATAEAFDPEGWFRTGDIGTFDPDGLLQVVERKRDLIVTAHGHKVAPQQLERQLSRFPIVRHALVHGNKRKYLSALISINEAAARAALGDGSEGESLTSRPEVIRAVQRAIMAANVTQPPFGRVRRFALVDEFSQEGGELTVVNTLKREACTEKYRALLDALYVNSEVGARVD